MDPMGRCALLAVGLVLACSRLADAVADGGTRRPLKARQASVVPAAPQVVRTIAYDTGFNAGFHPDSSGSNQNRVVGNRFNTVLGGPMLPTNRVTRLTVFPANGGPQSLSVAGAPNTMGSAAILDYVNAALVANQFNSVPFSPGVTVGPDCLGLFLGRFGATQPAGLLGMSDMPTMGQGYHAVQGLYIGQMATMIEVVPNRNAMLRATGDFIIPVELMTFEIE